MTVSTIFLDSGAFSSWKQGVSIDLNAYIAFIECHEASLCEYINLDVIPGQFGEREHNVERIEEAAALSYANLQVMKDAGLRPIPVFHQYESFHWLKRMLDDGEPCIALSPHHNAHRRQIIAWLDDCFAILLAKGRPPLVHGLGVTSPLILRRYPWTTVDSAAWVKRAGMGQIPIARYSDGKPDYAIDPFTLSVTDRSRHAARHIDTIPEFRLVRVHQYLGHVGTELAYTRYSFEHRCRVWIAYQSGLEAYCGVGIVSVAANAQQAHMLAQAQVRRRLVSYFYLKDLPDAALADFVAERTRPPSEPKPPPVNWHSDRYIAWRKLQLHERVRRGTEVIHER